MPLALAAGVNVKLEISAVLITSFALTADPLKASVPAAGKVLIVIELKLSPLSTSEKLNSLDAKVWAVSSVVVTVLFAAVGASFAAVTFTVIV